MLSFLDLKFKVFTWPIFELILRGRWKWEKEKEKEKNYTRDREQGDESNLLFIAKIRI